MSASAVSDPRAPRERVDAHAVDLMIAVAGDPTGVGGGMTLASAVTDVVRGRGDRARIIGWSSSAHSASDDNVAPLPVGRFTWRVAARARVRRLAAWLRSQPRPERLVAVSPFWVLAARRAWPDVSVSYAFPCLLANCLPFTWKDGAPSNRWERFEFEHIRRVERTALAVADRIVVQTPSTADEVLEFAPEAQLRLRICPTGAPSWVPVASHERARTRVTLGASDGELLFLWVGRFDRNKDPLLAVRALALARTPFARLAMCGDGPVADDVRHLARALNVEPQVHFLGGRLASEMRLLYAAADALVVTSAYDTYPNAVVEAMAAGRPVIIPAHRPPNCYSGAAALVDDQAGWHYDRQDPPALASLFRTVVNDPIAANTRGRSARRIVLNACCWQRYADALLTEE